MPQHGVDAIARDGRRMTQMPETRYATTAEDVSIAYQIVGAGEPDIVFVNSAFTSNVELLWEWPMTKGLIEALRRSGASCCSTDEAPASRTA